MQQLYTTETYTLRRPNGSPIRVATLVRRADGKVLRFMEKMPKGEAIRQAAGQREEVWK
jgi:hypothetical protein